MRRKIVTIARTALLVLGLATLSGCYADRYGYSQPAYGYSPYSYSTLPPAYEYAPPAYAYAPRPYAYSAPAYRYRYDEEHHPYWHTERKTTHARDPIHHDDDDE